MPASAPALTNAPGSGGPSRRTRLRVLLAFSLIAAQAIVFTTSVQAGAKAEKKEVQAEEAQAEETSQEEEISAKEQSKADQSSAKDQAKANEKAAKDQSTADQSSATSSESTGLQTSSGTTSTSGSAEGGSSQGGGKQASRTSTSTSTAMHPGCDPADKKHIVYHFEFADGRVVDGCTAQGDIVVAGFSQPIHISCSDPFTGGYGTAGSPVQALGEPQILNYLIIHYDVDNGVETEKKRCGGSFGPPPPPPGPLSVDVVKTNDANNDGTFNDVEEAPQPGASVNFKAVVTNTGTTPLVIDSLVDVFPGSTLNVCANLLGTVLNPGASVTCLFTVAGYAPAPGSTLTDTVTVVAHQQTTPANTVTDSDDSGVFTGSAGGAGGLSVDVVKTNDANNDGTFNDVEEAPRPGASVNFKAVVTNTGTTPLVIDSLVDVFPGSTLNVCLNLLGTVLNPGASVTCLFTVAGYAPAPGSTLTDTVTVVAHQQTTPANTVTDSDASAVTSGSPAGGAGGPGGGGGGGNEPVDEQGEPVVPPGPPEPAEVPGAGPLPFTGLEASSAVLVSMGMFLLGSLLLALGHRRGSRGRPYPAPAGVRLPIARGGSARPKASVVRYRSESQEETAPSGGIATASFAFGPDR